MRTFTEHPSLPPVSPRRDRFARIALVEVVRIGVGLSQHVEQNGLIGFARNRFVGACGIASRRRIREFL